MTFLRCILFFCLWAGSYTAQSPRATLQDDHQSNVTHMLVHPNGDFFFTADETGKIIMWNAKNYSYEKTIADSRNGRPIRGMQFRYAEELLMVQEGLHGQLFENSDRSIIRNYMEGDSVVFYSWTKERAPRRIQLSVDLFPREQDSIFLIAGYRENAKVLLGFEDKSSQSPIFEYNATDAISAATISYSRQVGAVAELPAKYLYKSPKSQVVILDLDNSEISYERLVDGRVFHMVFSTDNNYLYLLSHQTNAKDESFIVCQTMDWKKDILLETTSIKTSYSSLPRIQLDKSSGYRLILLSRYDRPLFIQLDSDGFHEMDIELPISSVSAAAFIPHTNHLVCWKESNPYYGNNPLMFVYDFKAKVELSAYHRPSKNYAQALWLPGDNWVVSGIEEYKDNIISFSNQRMFLKYYQQGTLNNRFARLHFRDYLRQKHQVDIFEGEKFFIDSKSGHVVTWGILGNPLENKYQFIIYDLVNDRIDSSIQHSSSNHPIGYSAESKRILTSQPDGWGNLFTFEVLSEKRVYAIHGKHKRAVLSGSGEYVLTQDERNRIRIIHVQTNKVEFEFEDIQVEANLKSVDRNTFSFSYKLWDDASMKYKAKTIVIDRDKNKFTTTELEDVMMLDYQKSGDFTALLVEDIGVFTSNGFLPYPSSNFPTAISLNQDGSKMFVSLKGGSVEVYSTENSERVGVMFHPEGNAHILWESGGNYLSNTTLKHHLQFKNDSQGKELDHLHNQPAAVLNMLGSPNQTFIDVLEAAQKYRVDRALQVKAVKTDTILGPLIEQLLVDGDEKLSVTTKQSVDVRIKVVCSDSEIKEVGVTHNGVRVETIQPNIRPVGQLFEINFPLTLINGDNYLEFYVVDESGRLSAIVEKYIFLLQEEVEGDLYVFAVGISNYENAKFNLTFADKDAMDIAMLYGDSTVVDMEAYRHEFFGQRYRVVEENGVIEGMTELPYYKGSYSYLTDLIPLDYAGRYWVEKGYAEKLKLWDFVEGKITEMNIPVEDVDLVYGIPLKPSPDNTGFYFQNKHAAWFFYEFTTDAIYPFNLAESEEFFPLLQGRILRVPARTDNSTNLKFSIGVRQNDHTFHFEDVEVQFEGYNYPVIKAVSKSGKRLLLDHYNDYYIASLSGENWQIERIELEKSDCYSYYHFTADEEGVVEYCWYLNEKDESVHRFDTYSIRSKNRERKEFVANNDQRIGFSPLTGLARWIEVLPSKAKAPVFSFKDEVDVRSSIKPHSFNQVHIQLLTNSEATHSTISSRLQDFLQTTKPNDQVMLFFAGHGMLDEQLNFYFAPHDMNFANPSEKGISYRELLGHLESAKSLRKLVLLDACHSGAIYSVDRLSFNPEIAQLNDFEKRGLTPVMIDDAGEQDYANVLELLFENMNASTGITVISASSGVDYALESKEISNGAFTGAFIAAIESELRGSSLLPIDANSMRTINLTTNFLYGVQRVVINATNWNQIPNIRELNNRVRLKVW
jgi:hypothetical protein